MEKTKVSKRPTPTNEEVPFTPLDLFFSITDKRGVIKTGNDIFMSISGYTKQEMIGSPHSIVRHPDMPRGVFYLLWESIKSDQPLTAYVKNITKDGRYYWVIASVIPIKDGYLSIRIKPTENLKEIEDLYAKTRNFERKVKPEESAKFIGDELQKMGYKGYDDFMFRSLVKELLGSDNLFRANEKNLNLNFESDEVKCCESMFHKAKASDKCFDPIFGLLDVLTEFETQLKTNIMAVIELARNIGLLSINAASLSYRIGAKAATLAVVAGEIQAVTNDMKRQVEEITIIVAEVLTAIQEVGYQIANSRLQIRMLVKFISDGSRGGNIENFAEMKSNSSILLDVMTNSTRKVVSTLEEMSRRVRTLDGMLQKIREESMRLEMIRKSGLVEAAKLEVSSHEFKVIFDEIIAAVHTANRHLEQFGEVESRVVEHLALANKGGSEVRQVLGL